MYLRPAPGRQAASTVLTVRPRHFGFNAETAVSNRFQLRSERAADVVREAAIAEHGALLEALRDAGVQVLVGDDTDEPRKPDAVFPNNWVSLHADGTVILYPLEAPARRAERRLELIEAVCRASGLRIARVLDLSPLEARGHYLEGTGSLVFDHAQGLTYAALSSRTHPQALAELRRLTGFETLAFRTADEQGVPLYHTNVMLSVGQHFAVICAAAIPDVTERREVLERLAADGREVIEIDLAQMRGFAANILELQSAVGAVIAMSAAARAAFRPEQLAALARHGQLVAVPVPTIEQVGGGSVRCMLAEIFLPRVA